MTKAQGKRKTPGGLIKRSLRGGGLPEKGMGEAVKETQHTGGNDPSEEARRARKSHWIRGKVNTRRERTPYTRDIAETSGKRYKGTKG